MLRMETYFGHVKAPNDAIVLFEACRIGSLPRVQRRLSEKERQQIRSGSVFVWDEREAGMRRWTDGKSWSASRVSGSFLTYREMEGKRGGGSNLTSPAMGSGAPNSDQDNGDAPDGYRYKADGLVKQSFSITTNVGQHLHLISYFARTDPAAATLPNPTNDAALRHIRPAKGMYPESAGHDGQTMPAVTRSPMADSPYNSSPAYGQTQNYLRHAPPTFAWPPSPHHTPPAMGAHFPPAYIPYPYAGPNGVPLWGPHPAYYAPHFMPPGPTSFDRVPPPLRGTGVPPPPPPAPAQPYPQHRQQPYTVAANYTPLPAHLSASCSPIGAIPPIARKRSHDDMNGSGPESHEPFISSQDNTRPTSLYFNAASSPDQRTDDRKDHSHRPTLSHHSSANSINGTSALSKNIPSINSLINKSPTLPPPPAPVPQPTLSGYNNYSNGYSVPPSGPPQLPDYNVRPSETRPPELPEKGAPQQPGYGEDMNALRRLDRAFAP